jgi:glycosyltransferase involved in cell wall biosynthesis
MSEADPVPSASIVIPAHDEGAVLPRCLDAILRGSRAGEFDVVVVANACADDTAEAARRAGVRVIETPVVGKGNAIRLGDASCSAFPRVYLDADVDLDTDSLRALIVALSEPGVLACAPQPDYDLRGTSWAARRAHRVHCALMEYRRGLSGAGAYALNRDGHARAFPIPDIIADDAWVHRAFEAHERRVVATARSVVRPAATLRSEVRRRARVRLGNQQLDQIGHRSSVEPLRLPALADRVRDGSVGLVDVACFLAGLAADRALTARRRRSREISWSADSTRRTTQVVRADNG